MREEESYHNLSEQFLTRAREIKNPDLKAIYLRLAMVYDELARFHERVKPLVRFTGGDE